MERPTKRRKYDQQEQLESFDLLSPDPVHQWLEFRQSTDTVIKDGINTFKDYLSHVSQLSDVSQQSKQLRLLKQYCEWQKAPSDDQLHFYDILSTWSLAVDNNAEAVLSAVPAALAQFLRTISGNLELRTFGLALIDTLLRRDLSKPFERCLASPRSKPHLASPCLRLLTEIVSFDAGSRATQLWARRDLVMQKFESLLEQYNSNTDLEERRKPSVRRMALRLVLSMLKYLDSSARTDMLGQARVLHACLRGLNFDGADIVCDFIQSLDQYLLSDRQIPRSSIVRFPNATHLESLATLYKFNMVEEENDTALSSVREVVDNFLLRLCTTEHGILLPDRGWYPKSSVQMNLQFVEDDFIDLGLDSPFHNDITSQKSPVKNAALSMFIQKLKPNDDSLQSNLLQMILRAAPELVAEYFSKSKSLPVAASDDVSWRGSFAFLFTLIESPIPDAFGWRDGQPQNPPPSDIVTENIIPSSLHRAYLNKLISSEDELLKISGARVLTVALKKLDDVLSMFRKFSVVNSYVWQQAREKVLRLVEARIPATREILVAFQHTASASTASYTALLQCVASYYRVLPNVSAAAAFDISPVLVKLCSTIVEKNAGHIESILGQLESATQIAEVSTSTRWLHKANNDTISSLGWLINASAHIDQNQTISRVVRTILVNRGVVHSDLQSFTALHNSLKSGKKFDPSTELFLFVDNCLTRANQKPVKCLDEIENASRLVSDKKPLSLFVGTIPEQWSYACKKYENDKSALKNIASWVARLFAFLDSAGENYRVMTQFLETMLKSSPGKSKEYLQKAIDKVRKSPSTNESGSASFKESGVHNNQIPSSEMEPFTNELSGFRGPLIPVPDNLENLDKWPTTLDIELEIQTQRLQKLILCLSSSDEEIRLQAFQLLTSIAHTIDTSSSYEGKSQIYLLLGELIETVRQHDGLSTRPLPTLIPELANTCLNVLINPTHNLYTKINKFLLHAPAWTPKRTLSYWLEKILLREPDSDASTNPNEFYASENDVDGIKSNNPDTFELPTSGFLSELHWLLNWLRNSLRNEIDLDLYRRAGLWERLLSLYASPVLVRETRRLILGLLLQACNITGGADILWTRFGVASWLEMMVVLDKESTTAIEAIKLKLIENCNQDMLRDWKVMCKANRGQVDNRMELDVEVNGHA